MRYLAKAHYALEETDEGTWAVSYGDMITLLLSFFVIFFTTDPKQEKAQNLTLHLVSDIRSLDFKAQLSSNHARLKSINPSEFMDLKLEVRQVGQKVFVTFGEFSFFRSGKTELNEEAKLILQEFSQKFVPFAGSYSLSIKAFTDSKKVDSSKGHKFKDNLELSALRSVSAMRVLQRSGIPLSRLEIAGAGEMRGLNILKENTEFQTKEQREALSRTVVLVISPEQEGWL